MVPFADPTLPISRILRDTCSSVVSISYKAVARNLLSDHRVSSERFSSFSAFAGDLSRIDVIQRALESYQLEEVRPSISARTEPAYARTDNENNRVRLAPGSHVATVLDLTRLGRIYAEAGATFGLPAFRLFAVTDPRNVSQINDFIGRRLGDPLQRESFLREILRARRRYRKTVETRVHPMWVAEWKSLQHFLDPVRPERWLQAVGVPREHPAWLAVFRYPVKRGRHEVPLFRPTQLDAGWYAHHFPSPPQAAPVRGGHTMYLWQSYQGSNGASSHIVSEFLHPQIDLTMEHWRSAGSLVGFAPAVRGDLADQRQRHWVLLQSAYSPVPIRSWMPDIL